MYLRVEIERSPEGTWSVEARDADYTSVFKAGDYKDEWDALMGLRDAIVRAAVSDVKETVSEP